MNLLKGGLVGLLMILGCSCGDSSSASEDASTISNDSNLLPEDASVDPADAAVLVDASGPTPGILTLSGNIAPVHDPMIVATESNYYLFATGVGINTLKSTDLRHWTNNGAVFANKPPWIDTTDSNNENHLWAPHVSLFGGKYHLYYSASSFGSKNSCIGHATSLSLEPANWIDDGEAIVCSSGSDDFNAIDPAVIIDDGGNPWLAFGSFWGGIKMFPMDLTGKRQGVSLSSLATRPNSAIEAPFLIRRGEYYYLFESIDFCCKGTDSTYKIVVGRATNVDGPYIDRSGSPLLNGGGTIALEGDERWRGPGHNAILQTGSTFYNVYHSYDANNGGTPTLRVTEIQWSLDDWPILVGP